MLVHTGKYRPEDKLEIQRQYRNLAEPRKSKQHKTQQRGVASYNTRPGNKVDIL